MQQQLELKIKGLYSNNNRFSEMPDGALSIADNIVIDKVSVAESRRGQNFYGTQLDVGTGTIDQLQSYRNTLQVNYNKKLAYDSDNNGLWVQYSGTFAPPLYAGGTTKMKSIQAQGNNYFTTTKGVYGQDSVTTNPTLAGVPAPLSCSALTTGSSGFLNINSNVAYRIVIGTTDSNTNLKLSAPSNRGIVSNPSIGFNIGTAAGTTLTVDSSTGVLIGDTVSQLTGSISALVTNVPNGTTIIVNGSYAWTTGTATAGHSVNATINFVIPDGLGTGYFYQVYRSNQSATAADDPDDAMQLVQQANFTTGELTAGTVSYLDSRPDSLKGAALYTNATQEGALAANTPPPYCTDMCLFNSYAMFSNTKQKQTLLFNLVGVGLPGGIGYLNTTGNITFGSPIITSIPSTANLHTGMLVRNAGLPTGTKILSIDSATQITVTHNATANDTGTTLKINDTLTIAGTDYIASSLNDFTTNEFLVIDNSGSVGLNVAETTKNLLLVLNLTDSNTAVYGTDITAANETPGHIAIQERLIAGDEFYVTTSAPTAAFTPIIPHTGTTFASNNDARQNRVYISKLLQPEAVPIASNLDVGSRDFPIIRMVTLKDAVYVLKQDGNYKIVDQGNGVFAVSLTNNNTICLVPESVQVIDNQIYMFSTQGIVAMSDTGSVIKSYCIENELLKLSSSNYANFSPLSFAVTYEADRKYIFYTVTSPTDTYPTQAFVYNYITETWTRWTTPRTCGLLLIRNQKLYTGHPTNGFVYEERKLLDPISKSDYADEEYPVTITAVTGTVIELTDTSNVLAGMTLVQNYLNSIVVSVDSSTEITVDTVLPYQNGAAIVYTPILNLIQFIPEDCKNIGMVKDFSELTLVFLNAGFKEVEMMTSTNFQRGTIFTPLSVSSGLGWGTFPWGTEPWGGAVNSNQEIRTYLPREHMQCLYLDIGLKLNQAFTNLSFEGVSILYNVVSSRFR